MTTREDRRRVIVEEGIRAGAVFIGLFSVVAVVISLGVRSSWIFVVPPIGGVASFALGLRLRSRTGMRPLSITRRRWNLGLVVGLGTFLLVGTTRLLIQATSPQRFAIQLLVVLLVLGFLAWRPPKNIVGS